MNRVSLFVKKNNITQYEYIELFMPAPSPNKHFSVGHMWEHALVYACFGAGTHPPIGERVKILRGMEIK